jgi:hypothetical protein
MKIIRRIKITLISLIGLTISINSLGQTTVPETLSEVVLADSMTKSKLYTNAKTWILTKFMTADNLVQFDDKEQNIIITTVHLKMNSLEFLTGWQGIFAHTDNNTLTFKLELNLKDNKFKYEITNILYSYDLYGAPTIVGHKESSFNNISGMPKKKISEVQNEANVKLNAIVDEMKIKVKSLKDKNDW